MNKTWRVAGINFDHFHMGDLLRMVFDHPGAQIVGIADEKPERMADAARNFGIGGDAIFTDYRECTERTQPDVVILCPSTAGHAEVAGEGRALRLPHPHGKAIRREPRRRRPDDRGDGGGRTAARHQLVAPLVSEPRDRLPARPREPSARSAGPLLRRQRESLWHGADKIEMEPTPERKAESWFYKKAEGGGSLLDYLGYGTTLATWYLGVSRHRRHGDHRIGADGLEVDEHCIAAARYRFGMSKFETRWGTFTDPWTHQPQPKCGFVLKGTGGTLSSYDMEPSVRLQTREKPEGFEVPSDTLTGADADPIAYFLGCLERGEPVGGPLCTEISRIGQQIVDTAVLSAASGKVMPLVE
ncbi:MAG: gfo/Idh/MocA family oxidoreductase [Verrucomicrobiales bacterium]